MTETTQLAVGRPASLATDRLPGGTTTALRALVARPTLTVALVWLALVVLAALLPGALTHHDPLAADPAAKLTAPDAAHWFGTDQVGRDVLSRVVSGAQVSIPLALMLVIFAMLIGSLLGAIAMSATMTAAPAPKATATMT